MNQEEELPEVQTQKRNRNRTLPPVQVNDVEDPRCYATLLDRLYTELPPSNVQQEGDLNSLCQLRWNGERVNHLIETELNHFVRMPQLQAIGDTNVRLMNAYRSCLNEKTFNLLSKQHLDTIKTANALGARVEKWSTPKAPRGGRSREI
jgi:hypothetical protein